MGAGYTHPARSCANGSTSDPERRPIGGQHTITLFGLPGYDFRAAAAEARASARQEAVVSEREAARRETAARLREFREALAQTPVVAPARPERQLFGIARAVAEIPRDPRAARQAACEAVARRDREWQQALAKRYPAIPARNRATSPASALKAPGAGQTRPARSAAFCEDAQAEYEAHLAEVAEARSHQLDEEADRYACTFAGAGYTEHLMACEG